MPLYVEFVNTYARYETRTIHVDGDRGCSSTHHQLPCRAEMPQEWRRRDSNYQGGHIGHPGHIQGHRAKLCDKEGGGFHSLSGDRHFEDEGYPLCVPGEGADPVGGLPICGLCIRGDAPGRFGHPPHTESDHHKRDPGHQENQVGTWSPGRNGGRKWRTHSLCGCGYILQSPVLVITEESGYIFQVKKIYYGRFYRCKEFH